MQLTTIEYQTLKYSVGSFVATITIDRPEKLNALSSTVLDDLRHLVTDLRVREDVRVVVITGSGENRCRLSRGKARRRHAMAATARRGRAGRGWMGAHRRGRT